MKKILTVALSVMTVMAIVSCGASPHPAREGYTNGVEKVIEGATQVNGKVPDFTYYTTPANSAADLRSVIEGTINLLGFYSVDFSSTIKEFQIVVAGYNKADAGGCEAELYVIDEYSEANAEVFYSTSCSNSTGIMNITFDGGTGSVIRLTGQGSSQAVSFVTIEDSLFYPTKFTENRKFYSAATVATTR